MAEMQSLQVQVCYATPTLQVLRDVSVAAEATLHDAIRQSGVLLDFPEIDITVYRVGIYGKLKTLDASLKDRDRIEIYRPLIADPKESRRHRAQKKESK